MVIGAGFSGAMTAVNLLRYSSGRPLRVVLVNKSGRMARGIAYGTRSADHVLNVPAGNMSALPEEPDDFLRFCRWADPSIQPSTFVSRRMYGTYLESLLASVETGCCEHATLDRQVGEVLDICVDSHAGKAIVELDEGRRIEADQVVLAFGHFLPANPGISTPEFFESERYLRDPWRPGALDVVKDGDSVLLLGSGLTAIDVSLALQRPGRNVRLTWVSRRGLAPQAHRSTRPPPHGVAVEALLDAMGSTARSYVRALRAHVKTRMNLGDDWRDVLAALRPHTAALWERLSVSERARFLRHVQPYWDVLRHRCAPDAFERYERIRKEGSVSIVAGRVLACRDRSGEVEVALRPRGTSQCEQLRVQWVVNCTGPDSDLHRVRSPLVRQLIGQRRVRPDTLGLGLEVSDDYAVVDGEGRRSNWLRYIGPLLRARYWEATAVPELRVHACALARVLLAQ